ncbi:MAG: DUF2892 domain-containing protein [Actinomycetia bacterium]|nr:DUF2892 domain-containing protein [Actinomycetes bacterium]
MPNDARCLVPNTGPVDRAVRGILGLLLVAGPALGGWAPGLVAAAGALGGVELFTAATGY